MKITGRQYAQYLYQAVNDKNNSQIKDVIKKFVATLKDNNDLAKANQIVKQFIEIWHLEKKIISAEIISAKKIDVNTEKLLKNYLKKFSKTEEVIVEKKVDQNLLGGVIIKYRDKVLDGSLRTTLRELKDKMVKA
ncbi:MAG: ATP synthase F1 subunit delta [Patescibacteria group bacterium]